MNKTLYVFRHGHTFSTKNKVPYGDSVITAKILPEEVPVIKEIGEFLKDKEVDYFVTSAFFRCIETAKIVSEKIGRSFVTDERLNEYFLDTEDFSLFREKVNSFLRDIEQNEFKNITICTHGAVIAAIKHLVTNGQFEVHSLSDFSLPGVVTILKDGAVNEIDFRKS